MISFELDDNKFATVQDEWEVAGFLKKIWLTFSTIIFIVLFGAFLVLCGLLAIATVGLVVGLMVLLAWLITKGILGIVTAFFIFGILFIISGDS